MKNNYCTKCECFHKKNSKIFTQHKEYLITLTDSEAWKLDFKRKWNRHKKLIEKGLDKPKDKRPYSKRC